jgi:hypothetical protein
MSWAFTATADNITRHRERMCKVVLFINGQTKSLDEKQRTILGRASQSAQAFFVKVREGRFFRVFTARFPKFRNAGCQILTFL